LFYAAKKDLGLPSITIGCPRCSGRSKKYGWAYALQNGTVVISDSKQDENNYSGSLGPLEYKFSVTFPCGRDSYRREVYKTRPEAIILMMRESLATIKAMAW